MTIWSEDRYRKAYSCGDVCVGAVYPPAGGARFWRWRIWVTASGSEQKGLAANEAQARENVEKRFCHFLDVAQLMQKGGGE